MVVVLVVVEQFDGWRAAFAAGANAGATNDAGGGACVSQ